MKKILFLYILIMIWGELSFAQTLGRKVFSNGGRSVNIGLTNYNFTIGEAAIGTKSATIPQHTIGFQQPIHNTLLPVSLLDFSVKQVENDALIRWSTVWEINSAKFVVERSFDQFNFSVIGSLDGAGESMEPIDYQVIDQGIAYLDTEVLYYRLKHIDLNGNYSYSQIEELYLIKPDQSFIFYPNPARDIVTLQFSQKEENLREITLWNAWGQQVWGISGSALLPENRYELEVSNFSRGTYLLRVSYGGKTKVHRLILI